jgi:Protein  of unknown function (DUF3018)
MYGLLVQEARVPAKLSKRRAKSARAGAGRGELRAARAASDSDLRNPRVRAAIRREAKLLSQHPESAAIDAWLELAYDWDGLR